MFFRIKLITQGSEMIVRAQSKTGARIMASQLNCSGIWRDPKRSSIEVIRVKGKSEVILSKVEGEFNVRS